MVNFFRCISDVTQTEFKITLVEKQKITLSDDPFPIDDYYKGWTTITTIGELHIIYYYRKHDGITKVIKAPGLTMNNCFNNIYSC